MNALPTPAEMTERVERTMVQAGWPRRKIDRFLGLEAADATVHECPTCGPDDTFRPDRPGRLTWYCLLCGGEGPPAALKLTREFLALEFAT